MMNIPAQTVGRAIHLLRLIASSHTENMRLVDIAGMASLDKSTTQRLLQRLEFERLLVRDPANGYRLGPLLYELGLSALPETNLPEISRKALRELAQSSGDMVFLVKRSGFETVCLDRIAGHFPIQTMTRSVGDRHPLGVGAGGLAILAALKDSDMELAINAVLPRLSSYDLTEAMLRKTIANTHSHNGFSLDKAYVASNITALGHVIVDRTRSPIAAVFVASISSRMTDKRREQIKKQITACVNQIERAQL